MTRRELYMHEFKWFVSRKDVDGMTYTMSVPMWFALIAQILLMVNVLLWGGIGVYEAVTYIV